MSNPALQEILLGGFAYFIESGVSGSAATAKPTTTAYWTAGSLGTILAIEYGDEKTDSPYSRPLPQGGFEKVNRSYVTQDYVTLQTREMNELVWRLQMGAATIIAEGTAQTPAALVDRKIEGWLRLQGRVLGGLDRFLQDWWCEVRLEGKTKFEDKVATPSLRFTLIRAVAGVAVAGNSVNFPAQA
jgi:hypothetical protein